MRRAPALPTMLAGWLKGRMVGGDAMAAARASHVRLSAYYFAYYAFSGVFSPYFTLYLQHESYLAVEIGVLMSISLFTRLFAPLVWGCVADYLGRTLPALQMAAILSLLGFLGVGLSSGFWGMAVSLGIMGFFWTAQSPLAEATVFVHLQCHQGYGRIRAFGSFGFVVCVLGMGWWLQRSSIDWVYYSSAAALLAVAGAALFMPEGPVPACAKGEARRDVWRVLRRPGVASLLGMCMLMNAAHGAYNVFFSIHLSNAGYAKGTIGVLWTLAVVSEIAVFSISPFILARFSLARLQMFSLGCAVLRFVLTGWGVGSMSFLVAAQSLHGITFGVNHLAAVTAVNRYFGKGRQAQGQAIYGSLALGAGGILGGVLSGWLWSRVGPAWTFTCCAAFAVLGMGVFYIGHHRPALRWLLGITARVRAFPLSRTSDAA